MVKDTSGGRYVRRVADGSRCGGWEYVATDALKDRERLEYVHEVADARGAGSVMVREEDYRDYLAFSAFMRGADWSQWWPLSRSEVAPLAAAVTELRMSGTGGTSTADAARAVLSLGPTLAAWRDGCGRREGLARRVDDLRAALVARVGSLAVELFGVELDEPGARLDELTRRQYFGADDPAPAPVVDPATFESRLDELQKQLAGVERDAAAAHARADALRRDAAAVRSFEVSRAMLDELADALERSAGEVEDGARGMDARADALRAVERVESRRLAAVDGSRTMTADELTRALLARSAARP